MIKEYLRLGRMFNAEIPGIILILTYLLTCYRYNVSSDIFIIIQLFIFGVLTQLWAMISNDRHDLKLDSNIPYCKNRPLVNGKVNPKHAAYIEYLLLIIMFLILLNISAKLSTTLYFICLIIIAYTYNKHSKKSVGVKIFTQFSVVFGALIGMSIIVDFDNLIFLTALIYGFNAVYLTTIEGDLKDIKNDDVNVAKWFGVKIQDDKLYNTTLFYYYNDFIKITIFLLVLPAILVLGAHCYIILIAIVMFTLNYIVRYKMFIELSTDREKFKEHVMAQELTTVLLISTIYMIINPFIPLVVIFTVIVWKVTWGYLLEGTWVPQV